MNLALDLRPQPRTKKCHQCNQSFAPAKAYFHRNSLSRDGLSTYCKLCRRKEAAKRAHDRYWLKRKPIILKEARREAKKENLIREHNALRLNIIEVLGGACTRCAYTDPRGLEIHHINGNHDSDKRGDKARLEFIRQNPSQLEYELLCANCHGLTHSVSKDHSPTGYKQNPMLKVRLYAIHTLAIYTNGTPHCALCGYANVRALHIDHVNGDGYLHRKQAGNSYRLYKDIATNAFTGRYQLLCANCNQVKAAERRERSGSKGRDYRKRHTRIIRRRDCFVADWP